MLSSGVKLVNGSRLEISKIDPSVENFGLFVKRKLATAKCPFIIIILLISLFKLSNSLTLGGIEV